MKRFCLILDLKDDPELIQAYLHHHRNVWPEIKESIKQSGIQGMEIYHVGDRLCMMVEAEEGFSFEEKMKMDQENQKVQEWEDLMSVYQKELPFAKGQKWVLMEKIFELK